MRYCERPPAGRQSFRQGDSAEGNPAPLRFAPGSVKEPDIKKTGAGGPQGMAHPRLPQIRTCAFDGPAGSDPGKQLNWNQKHRLLEAKSALNGPFGGRKVVKPHWQTALGHPRRLRWDIQVACAVAGTPSRWKLAVPDVSSGLCCRRRKTAAICRGVWPRVDAATRSRKGGLARGGV